MVSTVQRMESPAQKRVLLGIARQAARASFVPVEGREELGVRVPGTFGGAFVTFWAGQRLRGCIGSFGRTDDIAATVEGVTRQSLEDGRFEDDPITFEELENLEIEISILSELKPAGHPLSLQVGVHGVMVRKGGKSGCFLPRVAVEQKWSAEELLSQCCSMKAGLGPRAWENGETEVFFFTADAFSESQLS